MEESKNGGAGYKKAPELDGRLQHNHNICSKYRLVLPRRKRNPAKEAKDRRTRSERDGLHRESTGFGSMKTFVSEQERLGTFHLCQNPQPNSYNTSPALVHGPKNSPRVAHRGDNSNRHAAGEGGARSLRAPVELVQLRGLPQQVVLPRLPLAPGQDVPLGQAGGHRDIGQVS